MKSFKPETFWYIHLAIKSPKASPKDDGVISFTWRRGHIFDFDVALALYENAFSQAARARVTKITKKETKKWFVV